MSAKQIKIGTRKSELALCQSIEVKNLILNNYQNYKDNPDSVVIEGFKTTGDRFLNKSLTDIDIKGLFTKEIEEALLAKKISLAVHSMKDMPASHPDGINIMAMTKREDPRDAFISLKYKRLEDLPKRAVIGTSSTRRASLILKIRPDLNVVNFRGNINTRLKKIENGDVDATILAVSGLKRIKKEAYIRSIISTNQILPPVGQGAIGIQCRIDDEYSIDIAKKINDHDTFMCIKAERSFLKEVNGSCKTPIAAFCEIKNNSLFLRTSISCPSGKEIYETSRTGSFHDGEQMGKDAAEELKKVANHILALFT